MPGEAQLDPRVVLMLGIAAAKNALEIVDEADILAEAGHDARAFSLSVLATEELFKAWAAFVAGTFEPGTAKEFEEVLTGHHKVKLDGSLFLETFVPKLAGMEPDAMAHELDGVTSDELYAKKNAGMYVDLKGNEVLEPDRLGSEDAILGRRLRKMVTVWGVILQGSMESDLDAAE